ncbi:unnamed protein product, partial [Polarella glacialis]
MGTDSWSRISSRFGDGPDPDSCRSRWKHILRLEGLRDQSVEMSRSLARASATGWEALRMAAMEASWRGSQTASKAASSARTSPSCTETGIIQNQAPAPAAPRQQEQREAEQQQKEQEEQQQQQEEEREKQQEGQQQPQQQQQQKKQQQQQRPLRRLVAVAATPSGTRPKRRLQRLALEGDSIPEQEAFLPASPEVLAVTHCGPPSK